MATLVPHVITDNKIKFAFTEQVFTKRIILFYLYKTIKLLLVYCLIRKNGGYLISLLFG